jgi:transposase-like protein
MKEGDDMKEFNPEPPKEDKPVPKDTRGFQIFSDLDKKALVTRYHTRDRTVENAHNWCKRHKITTGLMSVWSRDPRYAYHEVEMKPIPKLSPKASKAPAPEPIKNKAIGGVLNAYPEAIRVKALKAFQQRHLTGDTPKTIAKRFKLRNNTVLYYWDRIEKRGPLPSKRGRPPTMKRLKPAPEEIIAQHDLETGREEKIAQRKAKKAETEDYNELLAEVVILRGIAALAIKRNVLGLKDLLAQLGGKV